MLDMSAAHFEIERPQALRHQKQIITSSHITASNNLVPERWGPAVAKSARGLGKPA
jgi:hypothetical protein